MNHQTMKKNVPENDWYYPEIPARNLIGILRQRRFSDAQIEQHRRAFGDRIILLGLVLMKDANGYWWGDTADKVPKERR